MEQAVAGVPGRKQNLSSWPDGVFVRIHEQAKGGIRDTSRRLICFRTCFNLSTGALNCQDIHLELISHVPHLTIEATDV